MKAVKAALLAAVLIMTSLVVLPGHNWIAKASESKEALAKDKGKEAKITGAVVRKYDMTESEQQKAYDQVFKIGQNKIESYSNNGGNYPGSPIDRAFDDDFKTHWEAGKANTQDFTNEINVLFKEIESLDRIVYAARRDAGGKGFAQQFEIYASEKESGNDFKLVTTGSYDGSALDAIEIKFPETKFKRLKFVFKKANGNWASASELRFFKKDDVQDQLDELFTDASYSKVNPKYSTVKSLEALENAAKGHLFESKYKVWIDDAKALIRNDFTATKDARTMTFDHYGHSEYAKEFRMDYNNVKSIRNNSGHWAAQKIDYAIDENPNTYWETNRANNINFNNEVEVEFKQAATLGSIVYGARPDKKGFAEEAEIYVSQTSRGDTYKLLTTAKHTSIGGFVRAEFEPTTFKRVKFKFKKSNQNWATLSELAFYKEDIVLKKIQRLFTDSTMSEVSKDFNTIKKLSALEKEAKDHPLYDQYEDHLAIAKSLLNGDIETEGTIVTAEQHGNMDAHASNTLKFWYGNNFQPTGFAARRGEVVTIYVDADRNGPLPRIAFAQQEGHWTGWFKEYELKIGKNVFTVPQIGDPAQISNPITPGGSIYIVNPYTPEQQGKAPRVRFEGATKIPFATKNTDVAEFKKFLSDYKKKIDEDIKKHPNVEDREVLDIFEFVSDHIFWTGTATGAYETYVKNGYSPLDTIEAYNVYMDKIFNFYGLDGRSDKHDRKKIRDNIRLAQPHGYMYSFINHIGVQRDVMASLLVPFSEERAPGWGITHEIGHSLDNGARTFLEITNNMISMYIGMEYNNVDNRIPFDPHMYAHVVNENRKPYLQLGYFEALAVFWQLELYEPGYWAKLESYYRENPVSGPNNQVKQKYLIEYSSHVLKVDLSEHFERHGFEVTDETRAITGKYPKTNDKTWYLNNDVYHYDRNGIKEDTIDVAVDVSMNKEQSTNTLTFEIDERYAQDVLGYEILKDGKVIGFTSKSSFVDKDLDVDKNVTYEVIVYDKKLKALKPIKVNSHKPKLSIEEHVTLKLRQDYDPKEYVNAFTYNGEDITSNVKIKSNNVNVNKKGTYAVVYEVEHNNFKETSTASVTVTSDYVYASDIKEESSKTEWQKLQKDKAPSGSDIKLLRQGIETMYPKGLGIHANSEVIYDIAEEDFEFFESYIGIDQAVKGKNSSATFEVWVDGKKQYTSKVFKASDSHQFIRVPIKGAKQVKLVTTDAKQSGNTADHTVWGSAKFTIASSKPKLMIPNDISTKVGEPVDLDGSYEAFDPEDGDLTEQVKVVGQDKVDFDKAGKYKVTYTVVDSDGNRVRKQRTIQVVDMENTEYLSDYDWESIRDSYKPSQKDQSIDEKPLTLTNQNGDPVVYKKGIGTHANSTIVYDLTKINAAYLSSYVGVERSMYNSVASIVFQVFVDGEERYNSGLMRAKDPQKHFEVDLSNGKELKIVVSDGGNGNGSDHAAWGDAKLHFAGEEKIHTVVDPIDSNSTTVTGLTKPNTVVEILNGKKEEVGQGKVNKDGDIKVEIKKQQAGTKLTIVVKDQDGNEIDRVIVEVEQGVIDVTKLETLITEAKTYVTDDTYTKESLSKLQKQIEVAEKIANEAKSDKEVADAIDELQQAIDGLEKNPEIDTSKLESLIKQAKAFTADDYTADSFAKLAEAIRAAESIVQDPKNQQAVEDAVLKLQKAIDGLVREEEPSPEPKPEVIDTSALEKLIGFAEAHDQAQYTSDSFAKVEGAIRTAKSVLANPKDQKSVDQAEVQLQKAIDGLVRKEEPSPEPEPEVIDTSALEKLIGFAEAHDQAQYTSDSFAKVEEAIRTAKSIVANPKDQKSVDQAEVQLQKAIDGLVRKEEPSPEPKPEVIDTSALEKLIGFAEAHDQAQYTSDSFAKVEEAIRTAKSIVANPKDQKSVDQAEVQLQKAIDGLVRKEEPSPEPEIDVSSLQQLIDQAKVYSADQYTADSFAVLQDSIKNGQKIVTNPESQDQVTSAIQQLQEAIKGLVHVEPSTPDEIDRSQLVDLLAHAKTYSQSDYTSQSYAKLQQAIQSGESTLSNATTQQEIVEAIDELSTAIMALEKVAPSIPEPELDRMELESILAHAKTYEEADYTAQSYALLQRAINSGEATLASATTQEELTKAVEQLKTAIMALEKEQPSIPTPELNKAELEKILAHAKTYEEADYTAQSYALLQRAINSGEATLANATTQEELTKAVEQLKTAIMALEKEQPSIPTPELNKAELEKLIAHAKTYEEASYTDVSYRRLQQAIQGASNALIQAKTQMELNEAADQLSNAIKQLEKEAPIIPELDTTELEKLIAHAKTYNQSDYTKDSFAVLQDALQDAEVVVENVTTEEALKAAIDRLKQAIDQLEEVVTPTPDPEDKPEVGPEDKPEVNPEDKPEVNPEDKPEVNPEDKPEVNPEDKPEVNPEDKPEVNPGDKPEVNPEDKPGVSPEDKPEVSPEEKPEVSPESKPEEAPILKPGFTDGTTQNNGQGSNVESTPTLKQEMDVTSQGTSKVEQPNNKQVEAGKGEALPKTATKIYNMFMIGFLFILIAIVMFMRRKVSRN